MKTKRVFLIAVAALLMGFVSCTKERGISENIDGGTPTYLSVSFTVPNKAVTRADLTTDPNATEAEAAFYFVDVFIFNPAGVQIKHARIPASEFTGPDASGGTPGADVWKMKSTTKIATTTGERTIIVGVNLSDALSAALDGVNEGNFTTIAKDVIVADVTGVDGFAMFSTEKLDMTLVKDPDLNKANVQVQRLVAKVTVQKASGMTITGGGYVDNLMFTLNNTNKKTFYVQPENKRDHNWATTPVGDLADLNTDYIAIDEYGKTVKELSPKYALENTTQDYLMGQITRATVRGTFVPKQVKEFVNGIDATGGYKDVDIESTELPKTFYLVVKDAGATRAYFYDSNTAVAFSGVGGPNPITYNDGYCYWDIFLNPDGQYDVYRNDFYRCNITKIIGPGRPTAEVTEPGLPPAQPTDLMVDIEILYWKSIEKDYELEP